jgi:sec-independent protein translocase protein TatA
MFGLGPWELGIIAIVVVLLFGTKRLPELGSGLGKAISNFRQSYKEASALDVTPGQNAAKEGAEKPQELKNQDATKKTDSAANSDS